MFESDARAQGPRGATRKPPSWLFALAALGCTLASVGLGVHVQGGTLASPMPMLLGVAWATLICRLRGCGGPEIQAAIVGGIARLALPMIVVLLVGGLVGVWMEAGLIPNLLVVSEALLAPEIFLPGAFVVCSLCSLATGSAYGTMGTLGIAIVTVAELRGDLVAPAAGAVICGAMFGDKLSPVSETTNLAAAMGEVDVFEHIRSMLYTTLPAALLSLVGFVYLGWQHELDAEAAAALELRAVVAEHWQVSWVQLAPLLVVLILVVQRRPALFVLVASILLGGFWGCLFQDRGPGVFLVALATGPSTEVGAPVLAAALARGGMASMGPIVLLIMSAGALGGLLSISGVLDKLAYAEGFVPRRGGSVVALVAAVLLSCYGVLLSTGSQALAIVLPGQSFSAAFRRAGIEARVMTRSLEDAATIAAPLVPWAGAAAVAHRYLGVSVVGYGPYLLFVFFVPICALVCARTGFGVGRRSATATERG